MPRFILEEDGYEVIKVWSTRVDWTAGASWSVLYLESEHLWGAETARRASG